MGYGSTAVSVLVYAALLLALPFSTGQEARRREVTLSVCKLDQSPVPCAKFGLEARIRGQLIQLEQYVNADGKSAFLVPGDLKAARGIDLIVHTPHGEFQVNQLENSCGEMTGNLDLSIGPFRTIMAGQLRTKRGNAWDMSSTRTRNPVGWYRQQTVIDRIDMTT